MKGSKRPKIAILSIRNEYNFGGVFATLKIVHNFCQQYFDPTVFYLSFDKKISARLKSLKFSSSNRPTVFENMDAVEIGSRWAFWEPGHYKFTLKQWEQALKDYDYFFVVSATPIAGHPLALLNKKYPIWISTPYNADRTQRVERLKGLRKLIDRFANPFMNKIEKTVLEKASFVWPLSGYSKQQFEEILGHKKDQSKICGYPIDCDKIKPAFIPKEKMIISIGRFSDPRKNIDMLIKAFNRIHEKVSEAKLYVIGQKPSKELLKNYASLNCFKNIVFTGEVKPKDLRYYFKHASLMLISSYQEGFGIVGLEALAYGVPVISTNCGGPRDFVVNSQTGYLVDVNDDKMMAIKAIRILSSENFHDKVSRNSRDFVEKNFDTSVIYERFKFGLTQVYPELASHFKQRDKKQTKQGSAKKVARV